MMHKLLEQYLSEVARHLGPLPVARRNEELREMRSHLESAVRAYQELGETEEEAVASTLRQYGAVPDVSRGLVRVWRRGHGVWGDVCLAAGGTILLMAPYLAVMLVLMPRLPALVSLWNAVYPYGDGVAIAVVGAAVGWRFPNRSSLGAALGMAALLTLGAAWCAYRNPTLHFLSLLSGSFWSTKAYWPCAVSAWTAARVRRGLSNSPQTTRWKARGGHHGQTA